ncbi:MAG: hypothetical protein LUQ26_09910, partial [Methylococcaceae bacterium]|nr:hypothetical protein [Methylococcaceae bacterium]
MKTQVTFTKYDSSIAQTKSFHIKPDGTIGKQATDQMYKGKATRITTDVEGFITELNNAKSKTAFGYGCHDQSRDVINIVTKLNENIPKGLFARNKENFQYRKAPGIMMYDLDNSPYGPTVSAEQFIEILDELDPSYSTAAILVRGSVSAGVSKTGEASPFKNNSHLYIFVEDASDIPRHTRALADRLWLKHYGFYALNANGSLLDKTIIDGSVFSPEHLDFVGAPTLSKDLKYLPPEIIHFEGGLLNTCSLLDLTPDERAKLIKIKAAARIAIEPAAIAKHTKWRADRAVEMVAKG